MKVLRGHSMKWWTWCGECYAHASLEKFTLVLLWVVLPPTDEYEEPEQLGVMEKVLMDVEYEDDGLRIKNQTCGEDEVGIRVQMQEVNNKVEEVEEGGDVAIFTISRKQL
ncbi:hypothetical protein Lal_00026706 [Lupinus albus]|nr:hypothetical protein Lal_00026706 [Lupinus albus]